MIQYLAFVLLLVTSAKGFENFGPLGEWDDIGDRPPNCTCSDPAANNTEFLEIWKWMREDWVLANLRGNETLESLYSKVAVFRQVCGTNNVTYANRCDLVNKAVSDPHLGVRCRGPCPCRQNDDVFEFELFEQSRNRTKPAICLNNNVTVHGWEEVRIAVENSTDIGVRCWGDCSRCATNLQCPRQHHMRPKSNETAPNCNCSMPTCKSWQGFLQTRCGKTFVEKRQICGSDNVTYENMCELKNSQSANPSLGVRCFGACPCRRHEGFGNDSSSHGTCRRRNGFLKYLMRSKTMCLNNGKTVHGLMEAGMAFRKNSTLGVRCEGECFQCMNEAIHCLFDWFKAYAERKKHRPHAPNCTCPDDQEVVFMGKRVREVCGNDGETYKGLCDLFNHQAGNRKLGVRCLGKCPCRERDAVLPSGNETMDNGVEDKLFNSDTNDNRVKRESSVNDLEVTWRRQKFCLTDEESVDGLWNVMRTLNKDRDLGVRCLGNCEECANNTECARIWRDQDADNGTSFETEATTAAYVEATASKGKKILSEKWKSWYASQGKTGETPESFANGRVSSEKREAFKDENEQERGMCFRQMQHALDRCDF